jgi:hypothetical protein
LVPLAGIFFDPRRPSTANGDGVIDLLATPEKWCKATLRTIDGRHCIRGAIMAVDGWARHLRPVVLRAINEVTGHHYWSIEKFNDDPDTHHAQVVEVLARARMDMAVGHLAAFAPDRPRRSGGVTSAALPRRIRLALQSPLCPENHPRAPRHRRNGDPADMPYRLLKLAEARW